MKIIDSHAHYDDRQFDEDRYELIERILSDNVLGFINIGCDIESSIFSSELSQKYNNVYAAVGIHPGMTDDVDVDYIGKLKELCKSKEERGGGYEVASAEYL